MTKEMTLDELQNVEYTILCTVAEFCENNGIRYGLCGGTLLGAVRHGGFIPWDDDIDIVMPRSDYTKFEKLADKLPPKYKFSSANSDKQSFNAYGKVYDLNTKLIENPESNQIESHVYIDVFPIDGLPSNVIQMEKHRRKCQRIMLLLYAFRIAKYKINEKKMIKKVLFIVINWLQETIIKNRIVRWLDKTVNKYDYNRSEYCGDIVAGYGFCEIMPKYVATFDNRIKFVDREFLTYHSTDYYLINLYKDYMKLPPIDKRTQHNNIAWLLDTEDPL